MNREFVRHLLHTRRHLREATLSLVPSAPRKRLRTIEREWRALIVERLSEDPTGSTQEPTGPSGPRRIDIQERTYGSSCTPARAGSARPPSPPPRPGTWRTGETGSW